MSQSPSTTAQEATDPVADAPSGSWRRWIALAAIVGLVAILVPTVAWTSRAENRIELTAPNTHTVARQDLRVTVTEQGTLESSKNLEIKCQVRGGYGGRGGDSTVTWVIPSGSFVEAGDELVRLDTKIIEETISLGKTDTNNAKAALARAEADLAKAEIAIDEYLNGRYRSQMKQLEKQLQERERNLRIAKEMLGYSKDMFRQGYMTELEVEGTAYTVTQAELELNVTKTAMDVLSRLTKAMELETLNGQLVAARARVAGRKAGVELEQGRLELAMEEFERCTIRAPKSGLVIYPSTARWKDTPDITEGASVHNNQVLLIMPDLEQMQVTIGVHESIVDRVQAGMAAQVTLPDRVIQTDVGSVAAVASPAGWWTGNVVNYDVVIKLPNQTGLKPGMSAQVDIVLAEYEDVVAVPVNAILEVDQTHYCWVQSGDQVQRRVVTLGESNDTMIQVTSGIEEDETVVLDPLDSIAEARELVAPTLVHTVGRGDLRVSLTEQGTLESSNNTQIKCRVRGASTVNWVIESGTEVKEGDVLVRLENKQIEDFVHERTKFAYLSEDAAIGFRAAATRAGLAIDEYLEGRFRIELMTLEKDLAIAEERLRTAQNMLRHSRAMFDRGYVSELDVQQKEFAVQEAQLEADIKRTDIDVLKRFTKDEELARLRGEWESAKAAANGHEEVLKMDRARIAQAQEELKRSVIVAERDGLVIYPTGEEWDDEPEVAEGSTVHFDQILLLMPDLSQMQVKVGIHETMVDLVKPGMRATVLVPGKTLEGTVKSVASAAQPSGWWSGNIVKYDTIIELPSIEGLKPGMSAEVDIDLGVHHDVLTIPLSAVIETHEGTFCWVGTPDAAQRRSIMVGESDNERIIVTEGLVEGDQVVLNPTAYFDDAQATTQSDGDVSESRDETLLDPDDIL